MKLFTTLFLSLLIIFNSCGQNNQDNSQEQNPIAEVSGGENQVQSSQKQSFKVDTIATGLQNPWGMVFLPDKRVLITERPGNIKIVSDGKISGEVQNVPHVHSRGQGGLLDIQLHPDYKSNGWIYISYSKQGRGGAATAVIRAKLENNSLTGIEEVFLAQPFINSNVHFGCRIVFDGNGYMFISTGERGTKDNAQDLGNHYGKVMRLHDDGRVPEDNPFVSNTNAKPEIWCYGNRNIQGMVYDKENEILWAHEHGPKGGDEINIIEKGKNYGWPVVTHGIDYSGSIISNLKEKEGVEPPVHVWIPSIAPCGMTIVTGDNYPSWRNNLLIGALVQQHIARVEINNRSVVKEERLLEDIARVRDVRQAPDGLIYVLTENPGMFLRLTPGN